MLHPHITMEEVEEDEDEEDLFTYNDLPDLDNEEVCAECVLNGRAVGQHTPAAC